MMGVEIAAANIRHGIIVALSDNDPQALLAAPERIAAELAKYPPVPSEAEQQCENAPCSLEYVHKMSGEELFALCTDPARLGGCNFIFETVVENQAVKRQIYAQLESHLAK